MCKTIEYKTNLNEIKYNYCNIWECNIYNSLNELIYYSNYKCQSINPYNTNPYYNDYTLESSKFCWNWQGNIISNERRYWNVESCQCLIPYFSDTNTYCFKWECTQIGMDYYFVDQYTFIFGVSLCTLIGIIITLGCIVILSKKISRNKNKKCLLIFCSVLFVFCIILGLLLFNFIYAGISGLLLAVLLWFLIFIFGCLFIKKCCCDFEYSYLYSENVDKNISRIINNSNLTKKDFNEIEYSF